MTEDFLPMDESGFIQVYQPQLGFEFDEKEFPTGFVYRSNNETLTPTIVPIRISYAKTGILFAKELLSFYHTVKMVETFNVNTAYLLTINPFLRLGFGAEGTGFGKWVFSENIRINEETFGREKFVDLEFSIKQLV